MSITLANAFSINMLNPSFAHRLDFTPMTLEEARSYLLENGFTSSIGHPATAQVLSIQLGLEVPFNRSTVNLPPGYMMIVAQATMPRLAEGQVLSIEEMQDIPVQFWMIDSHEDGLH